MSLRKVSRKEDSEKLEDYLLNEAGQSYESNPRKEEEEIKFKGKSKKSYVDDSDPKVVAAAKAQEEESLHNQIREFMGSKSRVPASNVPRTPKKGSGIQALQGGDGTPNGIKAFVNQNNGEGLAASINALTLGNSIDRGPKDMRKDTSFVDNAQVNAQLVKEFGGDGRIAAGVTLKGMDGKPGSGSKTFDGSVYLPTIGDTQINLKGSKTTSGDNNHSQTNRELNVERNGLALKLAKVLDIYNNDFKVINDNARLSYKTDNLDIGVGKFKTKVNDNLVDNGTSLDAVYKLGDGWNVGANYLNQGKGYNTRLQFSRNF